MERQTPEDLLRFAQHDPILHHYLGLWRKGVLTWDDSLLHAAIALSSRVTALEGQLMKALEKQTFVANFPLSDLPNNEPK